MSMNGKCLLRDQLRAPFVYGRRSRKTDISVYHTLKRVCSVLGMLEGFAEPLDEKIMVNNVSNFKKNFCRNKNPN